MMLALTTAAAAQASEKIDTVEVKNAEKVVIVTSDTAQQVTIVGNGGVTAYNEQVPLNEYKMRRLRKGKGKYNPWDVDPDLGVGFATPLSTSDGYGFATFRSREIFFGVKFAYTPEKALQTYSFGLWCDWKRYGLSTDKMMTKVADDAIVLAPYPMDAKNRVSRLNIFSLSVPLLFTQKFAHKSNFSFTLGPVVNFNLYGRVNTQYDLGDEAHDITTKGIKYNVVTVDLMAAFTYKEVSLYCKYCPMNVIKENKGPKFQSLTFGLYL